LLLPFGPGGTAAVGAVIVCALPAKASVSPAIETNILNANFMLPSLDPLGWGFITRREASPAGGMAAR
jgi:hypothetical protein